MPDLTEFAHRLQTSDGHSCSSQIHGTCDCENRLIPSSWSFQLFRLSCIECQNSINIVYPRQLTRGLMRRVSIVGMNWTFIPRDRRLVELPTGEQCNCILPNISSPALRTPLTVLWRTCENWQPSCGWKVHKCIFLGNSVHISSLLLLLMLLMLLPWSLLTCYALSSWTRRNHSLSPLFKHKTTAVNVCVW